MNYYIQIVFLLVVFLKNTFSQDVPPSFQPCYNYLQSAVVQIFLTKNITDQTVQQALNLSGRTWNDQGDIQGCEDAANMTFVEVTLIRDGEIYRGLCLNEVCDYETLQENKVFIQEISNSLQLGINMTQINFSGSKPIYPPINSAPFLIMVISISLFIFINLIAACRYLVKMIQMKNSGKGRNNKSSTILSENQQNNDLLKSEESFVSQILSTFDFISNGKKLFTIKSNNEDLNIFNGIRTISFLQVILGHEFFLRLSYMQNPLDLKSLVESNTIFLFVANCLYAVDVFFLLGGFFVSYVAADPKLLNNFNLNKPLRALSSYGIGVINRLFRILPCYFIALMIFWQLAPFLGDSPTWQLFINHTNECNDVWWEKLLFVDNLIQPRSKCFGWAWYLSNDMQMYLFSMILIMIYATNRVAGKWSIALSIIGFNAIGIWLSFKYNLLIPVTTETFFRNLGDNYYYKPWARCPPYFFGLLFGIWYKEYQNDKKNKTNDSFLKRISVKVGQTYWKYICYLIGLGMIFSLILIPRPIQQNGEDYWDNHFQNIWYGNMRILYVIGISITCVPAVCGSKDLIVQVLSCKLFAFLARLSFTGYLIHYVILAFNMWNSYDAIYFSFSGLFSLFLTESVFTLLAALVLHLFIEQPVMGLANLLFNKQRNAGKRVDSVVSINDRTLTQPFLKNNYESTLTIEQSKQSEIIFSEKAEIKKIIEKPDGES